MVKQQNKTKKDQFLSFQLEIRSLLSVCEISEQLSSKLLIYRYAKSPTLVLYCLKFVSLGLAF